MIRPAQVTWHGVIDKIHLLGRLEGTSCEAKGARPRLHTWPEWSRDTGSATPVAIHQGPGGGLSAAAVGKLNITQTVEGLKRYPVNLRFPREQHSNDASLARDSPPPSRPRGHSDSSSSSRRGRSNDSVRPPPRARSKSDPFSPRRGRQARPLGPLAPSAHPRLLKLSLPRLELRQLLLKPRDLSPDLAQLGLGLAARQATLSELLGDIPLQLAPQQSQIRIAPDRSLAVFQFSRPGCP